jgi:hypothetical protein
MTKTKTQTTKPVSREDLEKLACLLDDLICRADEAGQDKLSDKLNDACDSLQGAIDYELTTAA